MGKLACAERNATFRLAGNGGGWESPEMVRRYAHLAADHLAPYAERLVTVTDSSAEIQGTNLSWAGK